MKKQLIALAVLATLSLGAQADGPSAVSASSISATGASVYINGTGSASAGAFDKSGAGAFSSRESGSYGYIQHSQGHNAAWAHSFGGSWAHGTHSGSGVTEAEAWELSGAKATAGHKRRYDGNYGGEQYPSRED